jgi:16S rRNA (cytosine967-C5)-methyltransferase
MPTLVKSSAWVVSAGVVARWLGGRDRLDRLMEGLPASLSGQERAACQRLVYGVVRHAGRLRAAVDRLVPHPPRFQARAAIFLAGFELIEDGLRPGGPGTRAKIVHHAVERTKALASAAEARLVNAVVRQLASILPDQAPPPLDAPLGAVAEFTSHPEWLVRRWTERFGAPTARSLLEWNQRPAPLHARLRSGPAAPWLRPTPWPGFFEVAPGHWAEVDQALRSGRIYLQDPSTRIPAELLAPGFGESVLDLAAAPGGKSLLLADAMASRSRAGDPEGLLVALDLPGPRIRRLEENLSRASGVRVAVVAAAVEKAGPALASRGLPSTYDAVLLDAPCTNTGVMRHRVDVKWRLQEGDFGRHAAQQRALLEAAAGLVSPGGRLVYSTCSLDSEENEAVVEAFLAGSQGAFREERRILSRPWEAGHDGGGAFLLRH